MVGDSFSGLRMSLIDGPFTSLELKILGRGNQRDGGRTRRLGGTRKDPKDVSVDNLFNTVRKRFRTFCSCEF